jgi:AraC-like DNA-binding protein
MMKQVRLALDLLRDERRSIGEIAQTTGISSPSHLATVFRGATGLTPGLFRRSPG